MTSIKIKFRASSINGKKGILYYQIIHKRVVRQIITDHRIYIKEWDKNSDAIIIDPKDSRQHALSEIRKEISYDLKRLRGVVMDLDALGLDYSADDIVSEYYNRLGRLSFIDAMKQNITHLKHLGKRRTSETYAATFRSFSHYLGGKNLYFDVIDSNLMMGYEAYLKSKNLSMNTISFYMRILRAVYNRGVEDNLTDQKFPFKHVYTGIDKTVKRAITAREIKSIKEYDFSDNPPLALARDLFLFSFYTRGMSFIDMAYLKKRDLHNGILSYRRKKTGQQLFIRWESCMEDIVQRYNDKYSQYLLPIIRNEGDDPRRQYMNSLSYTNKKLKRIAELTGLCVPLTMYVARHSWASIAKKNHIPISVISEGMGHDSESTTQIYLASLDTAAIDKANRLILKLI